MKRGIIILLYNDCRLRMSHSYIIIDHPQLLKYHINFLFITLSFCDFQNTHTKQTHLSNKNAQVEIKEVFQKQLV